MLTGALNFLRDFAILCDTDRLKEVQGDFAFSHLSSRHLLVTTTKGRMFEGLSLPVHTPLEQAACTAAVVVPKVLDRAVRLMMAAHSQLALCSGPSKRSSFLGHTIGKLFLV